MKILMFSLDPNIVYTDRGVGARMVAYASLVDDLSIILFRSKGARKIVDNLTIYPTARNRGASFVKGSWLGWKLLRKRKYDLITVHDFAIPLVAYPLARIFGVPIQFQVHSTFLSPYWRESFKNTIYRVLGRFFAFRSDCVRAVSFRIKKDLVKVMHIPEQKITVLPIFTDARKIAETKPAFDLHGKYSQFDFILLVASRLVEQKNIELAIDATKALIERHPKIGLVIVGSGPHQGHLELKVRKLNLENNIIFEKWTDDVVSYYKGADVFLLTSNYEGWAMSVIEAMAAGTAIVMTDVGCAEEVVHHKENGIVVPVGDRQAFIQEIEMLYTFPDERKRLALAGQESVISMKPQTWDEYLALYKKDFEHCARKSKK